jgi:hypothetical protein
MPFGTRFRVQAQPFDNDLRELWSPRAVSWKNPAEVGSENGSAYDGQASGDEVKPALPVAFQDLKFIAQSCPTAFRVT